MASTPASYVYPSSPVTTSQFDRILNKVKSQIPQDDVADFSFVTAGDLKQAIHRLQEKQKSEKRMQNLRRLGAFVEAMDQFDKVIQVFLNASDYLGFIWGPAKAMLLVAGTYTEALNTLLDAYQEIGEHMPLLEQYEGLITANPHLQEILGFIYKDILEFHHKALKHFRQKAWRSLFHATWRTFQTEFGGIISNLQSHRRLLDSQAIFVGVQETMRAMQELSELRRVSEAECQRRREEDFKNWRLAVNAWLSPADSASDHDDALAVLQGDPGNGRWLLHQHRVREWADRSALSEPLLWINGKPGAGKTILASMLIEECRSQSNSVVAFFYCKHGDSTRDNFMGLARSVIFQLSQLQPSLLPFILDKRSTNGTNTLQSPKVAKEILSVAIESLDDLILIIDGLDECLKPQKDEISSWIRSAISEVSAKSLNNVRCCFLSQDDNDTGRLLKTLPTFKITEQHNSSTISRFCQHKANEIGTIFGLPPADAHDLAECVSGKADGMFLYAKLVMDNLISQVSRAALKKEMKKIPPDLNQLYGRIRHRILEESSPQDRRMAESLLSWLICAKRPLKWHEIQGAMCLDLEDKMFDADRKLVWDVKHFCGSLVEVRNGGSICFVHLTARFFLENEPALPKHLEQLNFTRLCFSHLSLPSHNPSIPQDSVRQYVLRGEYAFTEYALVHAFDHLHDVCFDQKRVAVSEFSNLVSDLRFFVARRVKAPKRQAPTDRTVDSSLCVLSHEDFIDSLKHAVIFSKRSRQTPAKGVNDEPVLTLEMQLTDVRVVMEKMFTASGLASQLTPLYGDDLFKCSQPQCTSFHEGFSTQQARDKHHEQHDRAFICSFPGCHSSMVGFGSMAGLQKHEQQYHQGVCDGNIFPWNGTLESLDIKEEIKNGNFPAFELWLSQFESPRSAGEKVRKTKNLALGQLVQTACRHGRHEMIKELLETFHPDDFNLGLCRDGISTALKHHCEEAASLLLENCKGISPDHNRHLLSTALTSGMDRFATDHLLKHTSSPFLGSMDKKRVASSLSLVAQRGSDAALRQILETWKIDPGAEDHHGRTLLIATATFDRPQMARDVINTGRYDKWAKNKRGVTALSRAGCYGHEEFIVTVFSEDPPVPKVEEWLRVAQFRNAVRDGDAERVTTLLDQGLSRMNETDSDVYTPWMLAVSKGHKEIVEILLQQSAIDFLGKLYDGDGYPGVVHFAAYAGHESVLQLLLQTGKFDSELHRKVRGNAIGGHHCSRTPLELAQRYGHHSTVRIIEEHMSSMARGSARNNDTMGIHSSNPQSLSSDGTAADTLAPNSTSSPGNDRMTLSPMSNFLEDIPYYDQDNIFWKEDD